VLRIVGGSIFVSIDDYNGFRTVEVPTEIAEETLKLAYSITVHKVQGSEYDLVILPIVKQHGKRILQRNLLYTALTRAKKKVIVLGQASAIVDAIENDKIQERNTLFAQRIQEWMQKKGTTLQQLYINPNSYQNAQALKQLLSCEEKASVELDTTKQSPPEPESQKQLKLPQSLKLLEDTSCAVDQLMEDLKKMEDPIGEQPF
jgi:superfamily I DNA and RNA helicase